MKVELSNGARLITRPSSPQIASYNIPNSTLPKPSQIPPAPLGKSQKPFRRPQNSRLSSYTSQSDVDPSSITNEEYKSAESDPSFGDEGLLFGDDENDDGTIVKFDQTPRSSYSFRNTPHKLQKNSLMDKLYKYIKSEPTKFAVSKDEKIIYNKRPILRSDLKASISRLINPSQLNVPSPPGTSQLLSKIRKDPISNRYFTFGRNQARAMRLGINQTGQGIKKHSFQKTYKFFIATKS